MGKPAVTTDRKSLKTKPEIAPSVSTFELADPGRVGQIIHEHLFSLVDSIQEVFWVCEPDTYQFLYVSPGFEKIWGLPADELYKRPETIIESVVREDRRRWVVALAEQTLHPSTEMEYRILRPDQQVRWIRTRLFGIKNADGVVYRVGGVSEDITDRKLAETEILEVSGRERRRMGQEIHDGICQHLTGLAYMAKALERKLSDRGANEAADAANMGELLQQGIDQARRLARGLYPIELESNGLMSALKELTVNTERRFGVACLFECDSPILMEDHDAATHLYRIAQEAVSNAVTHGHANQLVIHLAEAVGMIYLRVRDNGDGLSPTAAEGSGMGLRSMRYRARMIGATLTLQPESGGGTLLTCTLNKAPWH